MKQSKFIPGLIILLLALAAPGCKESGSGSIENGEESSGNLLLNPSFESNGAPSLEHWSVQDTSRVRFSPDVPPGGGSYSVAIAVDWAPPAFVRTAVAAPAGAHRYRLSWWGKSEQIAGAAYLGIQKPDTLILFYPHGGLTIDSTWTEYSLLDTIATETGDKLVITLSGGISQWSGGKTYYDLCSLEILYP